MKRGDVSEHDLAMLRARCLHLGLWFVARNDSRGGVVIRIGRDTFTDFSRAVARVEALEASAGVAR
jgi:hypothetical protein